MVDILYCFDTNYNSQALVSITSLIKNMDEDINVHLINDDPEKFSKKYLSTLPATNIKFYLYEFRDTNYNFPRIHGTHISVATYYRMFIANYLSHDIESILYLDADTVINKNLLLDINQISNNILKENILFGASSEEEFEEPTKRLNMNSKRYFNAGVMFINFKKWVKDDVGSNLLSIMSEKYDSILWWDQDILNFYDDGNYLEISKEINHRTNFHTFEINKDVKVYHFLGDLKPWNPKTIGSDYSEIYQQYYRLATNKKYHIVIKSKSFYKTVKYLLTKSENSNLEFKTDFFFLFLKSVFSYFKIFLFK
jgi:lipopolysaccharide biosynthesis glycosyltransferase